MLAPITLPPPGSKPAPDTSSDEAIARALAEQGRALGPPDTSLDAVLALQCHEDEVDRLCGRPPPDIERSGWLDGLVRSQLSGSQIIKLVPMLNPSPSPPVGTGLSGRARDRDRLLSRLAIYGLCEKEVLGDGNCQFRALSDQLYRTPDHHATVRARIVAQLAAAPQRYASHVPQPYREYVASVARLGTWGDHITLQAAADAWGIKVFVVTSFLDNCVISIEPAEESSAFAARALHLSFWAEFHYNSIYPASERGRLQLSAGTLLGSRTLHQGLEAVKAMLR